MYKSLDMYWSIDPLKLIKMLEAGPAMDAVRRGEPLTMVGDVAVIDIFGPLSKHETLMTMFFGGTSYKDISNAIKAAVADNMVKNILLRIDSPGGSVDGMSDVGDLIQESKKAKKIVSYIDATGASAAYYIASKSHEIYAGRTDIIGSIGTILTIYDYSENAKTSGVRPVVITSGKYKSIGVPGTEITEEHKAELQKIVDFYYKDFVSSVMKGRGMTERQVLEIADGRAFPAPEALEIKLIDGITTFDKILLKLKGGRTPRRINAKMELTKRIMQKHNLESW